MEALKQHRRKQREYNGNPLAYYRSHSEEFSQWKNRSQLSRGDPGMYRALGRAGQLEEAIPEADELKVELGRKGGKGEFDLSPKNIEKIIKSYKTYNGNAAEAARNLPYCYRTIWRRWTGNNLELRGHEKLGLSESKIKKIVKSHQTYEGNANEAARHLFYSLYTIIKYWRTAGLEIRKRGIRLSENQIEKIIKAHKTYNGNAAEAARNLPYCYRTIWRRWTGNSLELRGHENLSMSEAKEIVKAYKTHNGNAAEAARSLKYSSSTVIRHWRTVGLEIRKRGCLRKKHKSELCSF